MLLRRTASRSVNDPRPYELPKCLHGHAADPSHPHPGDLAPVHQLVHLAAADPQSLGRFLPRVQRSRPAERSDPWSFSCRQSTRQSRRRRGPVSWPSFYFYQRPSSASVVLVHRPCGRSALADERRWRRSGVLIAKADAWRGRPPRTDRRAVCLFSTYCLLCAPPPVVPSSGAPIPRGAVGQEAAEPFLLAPETRLGVGNRVSRRVGGLPRQRHRRRVEGDGDGADQVDVEDLRSPSDERPLRADTLVLRLVSALGRTAAGRNALLALLDARQQVSRWGYEDETPPSRHSICCLLLAGRLSLHGLLLTATRWGSRDSSLRADLAFWMPEHAKPTADESKKRIGHEDPIRVCVHGLHAALACDLDRPRSSARQVAPGGRRRW